MKFFKILTICLLLIFVLQFKKLNIVLAKNLVNTDYIHALNQNIENILDDDLSTCFVLPDFVNYLEFKVEPNSKIEKIKFVFDDANNNYKYKIYSSSNGYEYYDVDFKVLSRDNDIEISKAYIDDQFIKIRIFDSDSKDFINIKEIVFLDKDNNRVKNIEIIKEEPFIKNISVEFEEISYFQSIKNLISRTLGSDYVNFFDIQFLGENGDNRDYFEILSENDKIVLKGNNVNSIAIALNYYYEHFLNQTFSRFGDSKIKATLPLPKVDGVIRKNIDMKYRYNYNYVAYGYTMAYWDFEQWEREIDWMALNGFNMALNLVGQEEVTRRFLKEFGFTFSEIVDYLTSPIYLPWHFMGNITGIGGEITPKWFEDRALLGNKIQDRMYSLGINPIHQAYVGYFPKKQNSEFGVLDGSYWSRIKGPDRLDFNSYDYETIAKVFYDKQREVLGYSKYFAGDLFHEGGNLYGYDVKNVSSRILNSLIQNNGEDAIWMLQSWSHSPSSEIIGNLNKKNILIVDLHSQLNVRWPGESKFNYMSWNKKEFDGSNWIFGVLNNFGGRSGLYGHSKSLLKEFYRAKGNAKFLVGIGSTPEAIGYNDFIDELLTELIFEDVLDFDSFVKRYVRNRYGKENEVLLSGFNKLIESVYNPTTEVYHEGDSESVINARPSMDIKSASKWGIVHKNYDSKILIDALKEYFSVYDEFKENEFYLRDIIDIASEVIVNLAWDYYREIQDSYSKNDFTQLEFLSNKFLYLIDLQSKILFHNSRKSLKNIVDKISDLDYDDYFKDMLKYDKKIILTTWYDKLVSEDDGLRDYGNTDYYEIIGNLYYNRWKNYFDDLILNQKEVTKDKYEDYKFDIDWVFDDDSLEFNKGSKSLKELIENLIVELNMNENGFSFLSNVIYKISSSLE